MTTSARRTQLRAAKRRQRRRDRAAGKVLYQLKLPASLRDRLKAGLRSPAFVARLHGFVRHEVIRIADFPQLELLCWNLNEEYITREIAFGLYERNWRLIDSATLTAKETGLIDELKQEFGRGMINA
jgi:hypothetical protein